MVEIAALKMAKSCKPNRSSGAGTKPNGEKTRRTGLLGTTAIAGMIAALSASPVHADDVWTGAVSSDWFSAGNWSTGVPTGITTTVIDIAAGGGPVPSPVVSNPIAQSSDLIVGANQTASLIIENGGVLASDTSIIGQKAGSIGTVTVTGSGSRWISSELLIVGGLGSGVLSVTGGGTLVTDGDGGAGLGTAVIALLLARPLPQGSTALVRPGPIRAHFLLVWGPQELSSSAMALPFPRTRLFSDL